MEILSPLSKFLGLTDLFIFFNLGRVLFYLPSFKKMNAARNNLDSHSLLTWSCWIFANFTTGLMFYVQSTELDYKVGLNYANALMCCIGFGLILSKRKKFAGISESQNHSMSAELERENSRLKGIILELKLESACQRPRQRSIVMGSAHGDTDTAGIKTHAKRVKNKRAVLSDVNR